MSKATLPQRKPLRLPGYNYAGPNWYFITVCIAGRRSLLGRVVGTEVVLSDEGRVVEKTWLRLPEFYLSVTLENFIVMPNHMHGIIVSGELRPTPELPRPRKHALSEIVRGFKSMSARKINSGGRERRPLWQRGYFEHIIRDDKDLARIREYIDNNPIAWANDPENPDRGP